MDARLFGGQGGIEVVLGNDRRLIQGRLRLQRIRQTTGETETEVTVGIASLPADQANAADLLALARGHWGIENKTHYVRDVTFDEDRCRIRSGAAPQVVAAALRTNAGRPHLAVLLVRARGQP